MQGLQGQPKTREKRFEVRLHPEQLQVYHSAARYVIVEAGRRWGKTELAWVLNLEFMLGHGGCCTWWVAPLYKELVPATRKILKLTPGELIEKTLTSGTILRYVRLVNGAECYLHSADREDSLRGEGIHRLTIDEAPLLKVNRWEAELKPSLIDYNANVLFIGTPKGKNWFSALLAKGKDSTQSEYKSFHFSSYGNAVENGGFIPKEYIDAVADSMPEMLRRQEIDAIELEGEGVVFRHIMDRIRDNILPYQSGEQVFVGSDIAKNLDYYVNIAFRLNGDVVGFDRFNKIDYPLARKRTVNFCHRFGEPPLLIDSTGVGEPVFDELKQDYHFVYGYKLTNATKKALIDNLSLMLDNDQIHFPGNTKTKEFSTNLSVDFPVLQSELEAYTYTLTPSGLTQYGAPQGYHDDTVIAAALGAWQIKHSNQKPSSGIGIAFPRKQKSEFSWITQEKGKNSGQKLRNPQVNDF